MTQRNEAYSGSFRRSACASRGGMGEIHGDVSISLRSALVQLVAAD